MANRPASDSFYPVRRGLFLGRTSRYAIVADGKSGRAYIFETDFVLAVDASALEGTPFTPYIEQYMSRKTAILAVDDDGNRGRVRCLSRSDALDIAAQFPDELGERVRKRLIDAFEQLERFNADKIAAAEHFAGGAINDGADPEYTKARINSAVDTVRLGGTVKVILEDAECYGDKPFRNGVYKGIHWRVNKDSTGIENTNVLKARKGVHVARDAMSTVELQLTSVHMQGSNNLLTKQHGQIVGAFKSVGRGTGKARIFSCVDEVGKVVERCRKDLETIGAL